MYIYLTLILLFILSYWRVKRWFHTFPRKYLHVSESNKPNRNSTSAFWFPKTFQLIQLLLSMIISQIQFYSRCKYLKEVTEYKKGLVPHNTRNQKTWTYSWSWFCNSAQVLNNFFFGHTKSSILNKKEKI